MNPSTHKPFLTFDQQCERIAEYGIDIRSKEEAVSHLRRLGYYRLSAYWYPYRLPNPEDPKASPLSRVRSGIALHDIVAMCDFDDDLRSITLKAVSTVEVAIRVAVAYRLGTYGAMAYLTPAAWSDHCTDIPDAVAGKPSLSPIDSFRLKHAEMLLRAKEDFVLHFNDRYHGQVPVWAAIELWDFGTLSRAYRMLKPSDRTEVAREFGVSYKVFASWLVAVNDLRNFCAHHARLNRRVFVNKPKIPRSAELPEFAHIPAPQPGDRIRLYELMCILSYLTARISPESDWQSRIVDHFANVDQLGLIRIEHYGFSEDSFSEMLWTRSEAGTGANAPRMECST